MEGALRRLGNYAHIPFDLNPPLPLDTVSLPPHGGFQGDLRCFRLPIG